MPPLITARISVGCEPQDFSAATGNLDCGDDDLL
jgi:hypothetical protein